MNNPVRDKLRAGGVPMGVMAFDFFTPGLAPTLAQAGAEFVLLEPELRRHSGRDLRIGGLPRLLPRQWNVCVPDQRAVHSPERRGGAEWNDLRERPVRPVLLCVDRDL